VAVVLGTAGAAVAAELITINTPAPVSTAEGVGLDVGGVVGVGLTDTTAGQDTGTADATAVEVLGTPVIGGSQTGPGEDSGALLDTGQTGLGRLEVAPWDAKVTQDADSRDAEANAALARANLISPDTASVDVLQSSAASHHEGLLSSAFATSDALVLNLGGPNGFTIRLLHSESSSAAQGLTYIVAINDTPIISVDELGDRVCSLELPELLKVSCLTVAGGVGSVTSQVLAATVGGTDGLTGRVISTTGTGGAGATATPAAATPDVGGQTFTRSAAQGGGGGGLARTGSEILFTASFAVALMALGVVLVGLRKVAATPAAVPVR